MTDECRISRPGTGPGSVDDDTGVFTPDGAPVLYAGICRVKPLTGQRAGNTAAQAEDRMVAITGMFVSIPISAVHLLVDDRVLITASALDPGLVGRTMRVTDVIAGSQITARRLLCEEQTS